MAKKILFALLFSSFLFSYTTSFALNKSAEPESASLKIDQCNAPAPDSFRVTVASSTFVTLGWTPAWLGATHTVTFLTRENQSSQWIPVDTFFNVTGTTYTIPIYPYELSKVGFLISTNCTNGGTGFETKFTSPPIGFILDLTIGGISPPSPPTPVETCAFFPYLNDSWMGFDIKLNGTPAGGTNTFQLQVQGDLVIIKRVFLTPLVVGDFNHNQPIDPAPKHILFFDLPRRFLAYQIIGPNNFLNIGGMSVELGPDNTIKVCKSPMPVWNNNYSLTVLHIPPPGLKSNFVENRFEDSRDKDYKFSVQTPFVETLNIFSLESIANNLVVNCELWNTNGQLILERNFDSFSNNLTIPAETLLPGFYVLRIETAGEVHTYKVIKSEQ